MKKIKIGLIGYGNRGRLYSSFILESLDKVEFVSICDVRAKQLDESIKKCNVKYVFDNDEDFFNANLDLDLVIIASMDQYHYQQAIKCIEHKYNILLEKPIASSMDQVLYLNSLANKNNVKVVVCYVLRYTMFYKEIKKAIDNGEIGDIININTTENVAYWHQAHSFVRGNWRNSKETAPMILAKCSHDLDLLYWLMGNKKPARITSFGDLTYLKKENAPKNSSTHCTDCKIKDSCPFNAYYFYLNNKAWLVPMIGEDPTDEQIIKYLDHSQYSRCVFKCDNDVVDHQILNIEFEDKSTASHTMNAFTRWCYRDIKIMGTKGCIEGNFEDKKFKVYQFLNNQEREVDITTLTDDFVGHGGGDRILFNELIEYLQTGKKSISLTSLEESVVSHYLGFAAEKSRLEKGKVQEIIINEEK